LVKIGTKKKVRVTHLPPSTTYKQKTVDLQWK
jgi:hypothetical protein